MKTAISIALCVSLYSVSICAESSADPAKEAFNRGRKSFNENNFEEAARYFNQAYELKPSWKILYNIGQSEAAAKRFGLALRAFEKYLATGGDEVDDARKAEVLAELTRLRQLVGAIEIIGPQGTRILLDGIERGTTPLAGKVKTTASVEHELVLMLGDTEILRRKVVVSGGETIRVEATSDEENASEEVDAEQSPPSGAPPADGSRAKPFMIGGWTAIGVGAAAIAAGSIFGAQALSINTELEKACETNPTCASDNRAKLDKQSTFGNLSTSLLSVGGTAALTGIILIVVGKKSGADETARLTLHPLLHSEFLGVRLTKRF